MSSKLNHHSMKVQSSMKTFLKKIIFIRIFVLFAFIGSGFVVADFFFSQYANDLIVRLNLNSRNLLSNKINFKSKDKILFESKFGKHLSFIDVQMDSSSPTNNEDDAVEIVAYVTLLKSSDGKINYEWNLPEGVQVLSGDEKGVLESIQMGEPAQITLTVTGFTKNEKKLISLSANTYIGDSTFGNVGFLSSRPEDSEEFVANRNYEKSLQQVDFSSQAPPSDVAQKIQR